MSGLLITVLETSAFARRAEKLLSIDEYEELIWFLAQNPTGGDEIPGTGGVRKIRFAAQGKGKSGGVRVIYYYLDADIPLHALLIYAKNKRADLSGEERRIVTGLAATIKESWKRRK
jgi:hypothetical protein